MLVGRELEQQQVDRLIAGARIGESGVLSIVGEPGIGKTALLSFARNRLDGFSLLQAIGTEPEREIPFAGLLSVLRPALFLLDQVPGPQAEALSAALALGPGSAGHRFAIGAATLSLICRFAEHQPVAIIIDDLHWLDLPSAEALLFAARRLAADPVMFVVAARAGECDDMLTGLPGMTLSGLGLDVARDLVVRTAGPALTDEHLHRLHRATAGNPLAMMELATSEEFQAAAPDVPPPLPAALAAVFTRRIRLLEPQIRRALLVAVASGGGRRLTFTACASIGVDASLLATSGCDTLLSIAGEQIEFRHPLLRSAIYADADPEERRAVHRAVAEALPGSDADRRAWHLSESVPGHDARIAGLLAGTAARAEHRGAYAVASTAFERAARISPGAAEQAERLMRAAETAWSAGMPERAGTMLDELDRLSLPDVLGAATLQLRAAVAARTGSLAEACAMLERASAETADPDSTVRLLADAVHATFYLADTAAAGRLTDTLQDALSAARAPDARAVGLIATGMGRILLGRDGAEQIRAAVPLLTGTDPFLTAVEPRRLTWLMLVPLFLRDVDTGADLRRAVTTARASVGVGILPALLFHVARDQATGDSWARAAANYTEAIRLARETGQSAELAMSLAGLAWLESRQGAAAACRSHAAEALTICAERGIRLGELWSLFALGDLELSLGDPAAALDRLRQLQRLLDQLDLRDPDLSPAPESVEALLRVDRADEARTLAAGYLRSTAAKGRPWASARAHRAAGLVTPGAGLDDHFRAALHLHEQTPDTFETARTRLAYGSRLRRAGHRIDARPHLRAAMTGFADLGAALWSDQAAAELDATGERVRRRDPAGAASLTPQELQVSVLLAEGRTTREVAAALFLSPKTVEYHLRKVYTKLGIRSRTELARLLPR